MRVTFERTSLMSVTGTSVLPLADAKTWLRVDSDDEDALITSLINVSVGAVQSYIGRAMVTITDFEFYLPDFINTNLPVGPLTSIRSIKYFDQGNVEKTLDSSLYWFEAGSPTQPKIFFKQPLPSVYDYRAQPVTITCNVGVKASGLPHAIKHAVRLLLSQYYDQRENFIVGTVVSKELPNGIKALLSPYRNVYFV